MEKERIEEVVLDHILNCTVGGLKDIIGVAVGGDTVEGGDDTVEGGGDTDDEGLMAGEANGETVRVSAAPWRISGAVAGRTLKVGIAGTDAMGIAGAGGGEGGCEKPT